MAVTDAVSPNAPDAEGDALAALDALEADFLPSRPWWRTALSAALPPIIAIALVLLAWQLLWLADIKPAYDLPSPTSAFDELRSSWDSGDLFAAIRTSLERAAVGYLAAVVVGTPLGLLIGRFKLLRGSIGPIVSGLQSMPNVAWVPVAIIWFGLSPAAEFFVILIGAAPSIASGMVSGLDQVPPIYLRVGQVLGARGLKLAWFVLLPATMPAFVVGLRQGWAFAWRALMAAELIAISPRLGHGLGQLLNEGEQNNDIAFVFGMILVILVVGIAIEMLIFRPLERYVLRTRGLAPNR